MSIMHVFKQRQHPSGSVVMIISVFIIASLLNTRFHSGSLKDSPCEIDSSLWPLVTTRISGNLEGRGWKAAVVVAATHTRALAGSRSREPIAN
jgi:hypothetical protein